MKTKNLVMLVAAAVILGVAAHLLSTDPKASVPKLNGVKVFPELKLSEAAAIDFGEKLKLVASTNGWKAASYHGYPVAKEKLTTALLKLAELKVGQVVRGKKLATKTPLVIRDAKGGELVKLDLGEKHPKWGHGRYAEFNGETVLVSEALDDFDGEGKNFVETKIVDEPWISFNEVVEGIPAAQLGFATGVVAKVTIGGDTNRTITVGNPAPDGNSRYVKLDRGDWVYTVSNYSVEKFLPKPPEPPEKAKADEKSKAAEKSKK